MSKYKDPSGLQKAIDQVGMDCVKERYLPRGMKLCDCPIHGAYLAHYTDDKMECPACAAIANANNGGNGTTATQVEHLINVRDMVAPQTNPHGS